MEFNKEIFEKALKANKIVRYQKHFEAVVKSYLEIESQALRQPPVIGSVCDGCGSKFDAMDISVGVCYCCQKEIKQTDL